MLVKQKFVMINMFWKTLKGAITRCLSMYVSKLKRKIKRKGLLEMSDVILEKKTCIYAESEQQKQIKTINKVNAIFKKAFSKLDVAELDTRFIRYILNGLQQTIYSTHILCK